MKSYYKDFPRIEYQTPMGKIFAVDIMTRFKFVDQFQDNPLSFYTYRMKAGDRPDIIASRYYGSPDFAWVVLLSNDYFSVKDNFPLTEDELYSYVIRKYDGAINSVHHYEDPDGYIIDNATYLATPGATIVTNYDYERKLNEEKQTIKLISKVYLAQIMDALEETLEQINKE